MGRIVAATEGCVRPASQARASPIPRISTGETAWRVWICLRHLNRFEEAIEPLNFARSALIEVKDTASPHYHNVVEGLRRFAEALNRPDEEARWSAELRAYQAATRPAGTTKATTAPSR